jgi:regulator of protease activity HflC (stomatin/prohibitin superfamily)
MTHERKEILFFLIPLSIIALLLVSYFSFYVVEPGFTAVQVRLGNVIAMRQTSGFYFQIPLIDRVVLIDTRINKADIETTALSHDLQSVSVGMVINYRISDASKLYQNIGTLFKEIIIDPFTQESVKAIVAKFTAEDLIQSRHKAKEMVIAELKERLAPLHITLIDFNFTHLDFSPEFIKAVEDKQIADQSSKTAKNLTEKIKEEALQTKQRAEAEAYALKVKRESLTKELIQLKQVEAQIKAIEKWDGVLPRVTGGSTPIISLGQQLEE